VFQIEQTLIRYRTLSVGGLLPLAQQGSNETTFWKQLSGSFRQGPDATPIYIGIVVLILALVGAYFLLQFFSSFGTTKTKRKKYNILESIQSNLKLSDRQERYLKALIEKFKNRASYEPEISTEYLEDFLFFAVQNLTYAPKRSIRRKTHYVPDFTINESIDIMVKIDDETYTTLESDILGQNDDTVTIKRPFGEYADELSEGQSVDVAYKEGELTLRGPARIKTITDDQAKLELSRGMHFEEQRTYDRVPLQKTTCQLILQEWEGKTIRVEGILQDISVGGAKLLVDQLNSRIHRNMRGRMQFELNAKEMDLEVVVIHVEDENDPPTLGVEFMEPGMRNRNLLHEFVSDKSDE
jgi:hypothetical protein